MESNNSNPTTNNKITNMVKIGVTTFDLEAFEMHSNQCFEKKKKLFNFFYIFQNYFDILFQKYFF
jgi:hypothetical protein